MLKLNDETVQNEVNRSLSSDDEESEEADDPNDASYAPSRKQKVEKSGMRLRNWFGHLAEEENDDSPDEFAMCIRDVNVDNEPKTVAEIQKRKDAHHWQNAMKEEIDALNLNDTWTMVNLPKGANLIKTKWVFKLKRDNDGNIVRYKARLVAKGFTQRYGVDYEETFAPVVRYSSIRFLIAHAVRCNMKIHQMDAVTAFLQSDVKENIFLEQPEGFSD